MIGIDLGGTRIKAGLVAVDSGAVTRGAIIEVDDKSQRGIVEHLARVAAEVDPSGASAVGVAAAGVIDAHAGVVRESPNFPAWKDFALARELSEKTGRTVVLENDANAVVWGEVALGAARGEKNVVGYTLGTGVGGALVLDGRLWRGVRGMAGELGHVTVVREGRPCGCGNHGCLEQYVGSVGLVQTMREHPALAELTTDPAHAVAKLAARGDALARAIFEDAGRHLGVAAAALVHTLDVMTIVLCGGIGVGAFDALAPAMQAELEARTFRSMSRGVRIVRGQLDASAGIVGAAMLAS